MKGGQSCGTGGTRYDVQRVSPRHAVTNLRSWGEVVVAQICGRPYTHSAQTPGAPAWAGDDIGRRDALLWLKEKHDEVERRHDINEAMEVSIIFLVAIEVVFSVLDFIRHSGTKCP